MFDKTRRIRRFISWLSYLENRSAMVEIPHIGDYKHPKVLVGTMLSKLNQSQGPAQSLRDVEFQVFSQFGDDGIIQHLVHNLNIQERIFVEIGVENYTEANTRFLLVKDKWSGLVVDGNENHVNYVRNDPISMLFDVRAEQAFVTAENINDIISRAGISGRIGLLSIDIDGMDYWVWRAVDTVDPAIVIIEYNSLFGPDRSIVVPYNPEFSRYKPDPSRLCYGASLAALQHLAAEKGYTFIGCNSNGNNAYFVRSEYAALPVVANLKRGFNPATFSEYGGSGHWVRGEKALALIRRRMVYNTLTASEEIL